MKTLFKPFISVRRARCSAVMAALLCCLLELTALPANAGIQACRLADGTTIFQDTACIVEPQSQPEKVAKKEAIPFDINESWFDAPEIVPDRAICTKSGCHCDLFSRKFDNGIFLAIADALYLDGSWHRLESTQSQLETDTLSTIERADIIKERDEAACNILMSQKTLKKFGVDALRELRNKKRYAEDRGLDDPADCDAGDTEVCTYTDLITLYDRIQADIRSLRAGGRNSTDEALVTSEQ